MLTKQDKRKYREELFRHLDGIAVCTVAHSLYSAGVFEYLLKNKTKNLAELSQHFNANEGYLNVALRIVSAQGWLDYTVDNKNDRITISTNDLSQIAFDHFYLYKDVVELLHISGKYHPRKFEMEPFRALEKIFVKYQKNYNLDFSDNQQCLSVQQQILKHIEGVIVGPTVVLLGMGGMFHKYFMEASFSAEEYHQHPESFTTILDFLGFLGWFNKKNDHYSFTDKGLFFAKRSAAYGVTVSYIPMFRKMDELLFGDPRILWKTKPNEAEIHVDREMNVWGSGGAHAAYFKKIDEIVTKIFNQPLEDQPKGILDMGCGNGAFLIHLFELIEKHTLRGEHLEDYPLFLVGADYNKAALKVTRANLIKADIWAKIIWGDIGDPDLLQNDLNENYNIDLKDLLNVRTFLDHNRIWFEPQGDLKNTSPSTGAFAFRGKRLSNNDVERNLKNHFNNWLPYISTHGLILIELHTIAPQLIAKNIGRTAATAYDATHGFSDQYILEIESFNKVITELGLVNDKKYHSKFPNSELATVSINYIVGLD